MPRELGLLNQQSSIESCGPCLYPTQHIWAEMPLMPGAGLGQAWGTCVPSKVKWTARSVLQKRNTKAVTTIVCVHYALRSLSGWGAVKLKNQLCA